MTETEKLEELFSEEVLVFKEEKPRDDCFIDDMTAHICVGHFRFCVDMKKETEKELERCRKYVLKTLDDNEIILL